MTRKLFAGLVAVLVLALAPGASVYAAQLKGQIQGISRKAQAIQVTDLKTKEDHVINFDDTTRFVNAASIKDFIVNDKVVVEYEPGQAAVSIKRVLVDVPADMLITTAELSALVASGRPYTLVDARPAVRYREAHIPTAISVPVAEMKGMWDAMPADKDRLLIFYCGGPT